MSMNIWVEKKAEVGTEYRSWTELGRRRDGVGTELGRRRDGERTELKSWDGDGPELGRRRAGVQELGRSCRLVAQRLNPGSSRVTQNTLCEGVIHLHTIGD